MSMLPPESRYAILDEIFPEEFEAESFYDSLDDDMKELADEFGIEAAREFLGDGSSDTGSISPDEFTNWQTSVLAR